MKTKIQSLLHGIIQGIGFGLVLFVIIFIIIFIINITFDPIAMFTNKYCIIQNQKPIEKSDLLVIQKLYSKNLIVSPHDIFADILSYYNTLITILITVVGISSFVSYFYVKNISAEKAEQLIHETVKKYFDTNVAHLQISDEINKEVAEWMDTYSGDLETNIKKNEQNIQELTVRLNNIEETVEALYVGTSQDDFLKVDEENGGD